MPSFKRGGRPGLRPPIDAVVSSELCLSRLVFPLPHSDLTNDKNAYEETCGFDTAFYQNRPGMGRR